MSDRLEVCRAEFSVEDPWAMPRNCSAVKLKRSTDGSTPRLATTVCAYYDDRFLNVVFSCTDDHIEATMRAHDDPIYEEDVVEVFLAPDRLTQYFEIEVSPLGTTFDAKIESPEGLRASMKSDRAWTCEGLRSGIRKLTEGSGQMSVDFVMRIPFAAFGRAVPAAREEWRANFFRIDRHPKLGDEYSSWRPTLKNPADFHVAAAFGTLIFLPS